MRLRIPSTTMYSYIPSTSPPPHTHTPSLPSRHYICLSLLMLIFIHVYLTMCMILYFSLPPFFTSHYLFFFFLSTHHHLRSSPQVPWNDLVLFVSQLRIDSAQKIQLRNETLSLPGDALCHLRKIKIRNYDKYKKFSTS